MNLCVREREAGNTQTLAHASEVNQQSETRLRYGVIYNHFGDGCSDKNHDFDKATRTSLVSHSEIVV